MILDLKIFNENISIQFKDILCLTFEMVNTLNLHPNFNLIND